MIGRNRKPKVFTGTSILGAKSLAMQAGIPPQRQPDHQVWVRNQWVLIYKPLPKTQTEQRANWLGALGMAFILIFTSLKPSA